MPTYTYRCEYVRCGKPGCKRCPHGPYWYGYWREGEKVKKKYFGKEDPRVKKPGKDRTIEDVVRDPREAIFNRRTATVALARAILGIAPETGKVKAESAYKMLAMMNHPDRGGDVLECQYITAAWSYLKAEMLW